MGDIVEIDLTDNKQTIIASGVGIPGTAEPITLALDENNELYYFTANQGLNRFNGTSFDLVMNPATGAGQLLWIPQLKTFIVANGTGANIVSYNPVSRQTQNITPYINANAIVEMTDGTILVTTGDEIKKVTGTGFASFTEKFNGICTSLARDSSGNIYGGFPDGVIAKISAEGKITPWVSPGIIPDMVMGIHYDRKNDQLVVVSGRGGISSHADVWRLSINAPTTITPIAHFDGIMVHENLPAATVDYSGTVYILERTANVIYKIPDGTTESAVFANNVLSSEAITVPGLEYLSKENALVVSGVSDYYLWYLDKPQRSILAINNGAVDNFAMHENKDGNLVCIHSGQVFRLVQTSDN